MRRSFRFVLSVLSGVLLSLAWLGFPGWIIFIAFLPLLYLDDFFVNQKEYFGSVSFFGHAFLAFVVWNVLTTWWVMYASLPGAATAILLNSFFMGLVWWLAHSAWRNFKKNLGYIAIVVFFLTYEFIHYHWELEWPWLSLGNAFANNVKMIQWYEFTGVFGGSLWILVVNIIVFKILKNIATRDFNRSFKIDLVSLVLIIIIPVAISEIIYIKYTEVENPREVVIVQPNIDPYNESHDIGFSNQVLQKFLNLALQKVTTHTDFIVGPETIFEQFWDEQRMDYNDQFRKVSHFIRMETNAEMVFGSVTLHYYEQGEKLSETARERIVNGRKINYDIYNSALFLSRDGGFQIYHKSILVSGVEKLPYIKYLKFLNKLVINLGGASGSYGKQDEPSNFTATDGTIIASPICFESIFGEHISKFVKKGAQVIFIITNDGWWKDTPGYKQHMSFARLRAIETRRSIARSANTGLSCFIDQRGEVFQKTKWWEDAVIRGNINLNDKITFYVKYGDYIARISAFLSVMLILFLIVKQFIKTDNQ
ncbi:MAG: apolipoprotein N-acyltransferase [Prolixibacteraceae bacterium]|nr:apolipoprotein N-acyltransferase [Prolixibacteraceae bacterium]